MAASRCDGPLDPAPERRPEGDVLVAQEGSRMERQDEGSERGKPASFDPASGEVHGSGSGAGGGNHGEDYDSDPMAGGGDEPEGGPRPADESADRPIDPDEGR
jgi:hypothetical protein